MATSFKTELFKRLKDVGFTKPYITKIAALPTWWDDSLWDDKPSRSVGLMQLSRHLGIDMASLQEPAGSLVLKHFGVCKYKKKAGTTIDELMLASVIATRAAQLAAAAISAPYEPVLAAAELRASILERSKWVDFESLLDCCWKAGIPVIHVGEFPPGAKKPAGFTLRVHGRPAIVLCSQSKQPAWHLFILAHELGHLHCGHVPENGALLDESEHGNERDEEEDQADRYAIELLTGNETTALRTEGDRWPSAVELSRLATSYGVRKGVDPSHAVLNFAHTSRNKLFAIANAALQILNPNPDAVGMVISRVASRLDFSRLPEDSSMFLARITGQETPT